MLFDIDGTLIRRAGPHHRERWWKRSGEQPEWKPLPKACPWPGCWTTTSWNHDDAGGDEPGAIRKAMPAAAKARNRSMWDVRPTAREKFVPASGGRFGGWKGVE